MSGWPECPCVRPVLLSGTVLVSGVSGPVHFGRTGHLGQGDSATTVQRRTEPEYRLPTIHCAVYDGSDSRGPVARFYRALRRTLIRNKSYIAR
jgi:hypothetical protein